VNTEQSSVTAVEVLF